MQSRLIVRISQFFYTFRSQFPMNRCVASNIISYTDLFQPVIEEKKSSKHTKTTIEPLEDSLPPTNSSLKSQIACLFLCIVYSS